MEFGERRRTTWPLRMPIFTERQLAKASTAFHTSVKLSFWPDEASMNAIFPLCALEEMNVVTSMDWFDGKVIGLRLL